MCLTKWLSVTLTIALMATTAAATAQEFKVKFQDIVITGRVKSVDVARRTFFLADHKDMFKLDNAVIIRDGSVARFPKFELRAGDDVSIFDQAAAGNLTSYIMVKQGATSESTMKRGTIKSFNAKKGTVSLNFAKIEIEYAVSEAKVFVNLKNSRAEELRIGESAIIVISGTRRLTHVFVDRR